MSRHAAVISSTTNLDIESGMRTTSVETSTEVNTFQQLENTNNNAEQAPGPSPATISTNIIRISIAMALPFGYSHYQFVRTDHKPL
jgi:hypothetical protein